MDVGTLTQAFIGAQAAQLQMAVAASLMRMNADMDASAAELLQAASENAQKLADTAAGLGANIDITV